ncbi:hypothetical protein J1785_02130, partial [Rahnella sp. SL6]|uniref:hypothetical protein n=1 Tax=Rahnella perminowiae TaxID=2816244 RepID=UPI001C280618
IFRFLTRRDGWIENISVSQVLRSHDALRRNRPEGKGFSPLNSPRFFNTRSARWLCFRYLRDRLEILPLRGTFSRS